MTLLLPMITTPSPSPPSLDHQAVGVRGGGQPGLRPVMLQAQLMENRRPHGGAIGAVDKLPYWRKADMIMMRDRVDKALGLKGGMEARECHSGRQAPWIGLRQVAVVQH